MCNKFVVNLGTDVDSIWRHFVKDGRVLWSVRGDAAARGADNSHRDYETNPYLKSIVNWVRHMRNNQDNPNVWCP